jgi:IclR family pca regulon transcriptional regulator
MTPRTRRKPAARIVAEPWSRLSGPRYSQSLERGLAILEVFTPARPELGIADMANELGMSPSTTHRYARTLVALRYLEQGEHRKYRLGLRVTDLGMVALNGTGLRQHAHPYLAELATRSSYTTRLGVLDGPDLFCVDRVLGYHRARSETELDLTAGARLPAYCTAMGKLLLASLPEDRQRELLAKIKLKKRGPNAITGKNALREELERIALAGFAVSDEEQAVGVCAIAAPVRDQARQVVAAVEMAGDTSTISGRELVDALGPHLRATADRISARLGYRRGDENHGER